MFYALFRSMINKYANDSKKLSAIVQREINPCISAQLFSGVLLKESVIKGGEEMLLLLTLCNGAVTVYTH